MFKLITVLILICGLLINNLNVSAQNPPTGGPNPKEVTNEKAFPVVLYPVIGLAVGAASYFVIKKYPRKIPLSQHLGAYLLKRHILSTPDAYNLMYSLNPGLKGKSVIRSTRKLVEPDFPALPETVLYPANAPVPGAMPLPGQINLFKSNLATFQKTRISINSNTLSQDKVRKILNDILTNIGTYEGKEEESTPVQKQLLTDLLQVLNQYLVRSINSKVLNAVDGLLLENISDNLAELILSAPETKGKQGRVDFQGLPVQKEKVYATADQGALLADNLLAYRPAGNWWNNGYQPLPKASPWVKTSPNMEQGFAFAIYKIDANGTPITKGPEVEGKYFIQYACPALKDFKSSYHNISPPPATYATTKLPPAKFYLIVKDLQGNQLNLDNPLIDTRDIFRNPKPEYFNQMILVPIYVKS